YTLLSFPNLALYYRVDLWTEHVLGFGAETIAIIDTAAESPFAQLSMIPLLTLIAIYAPPGKRATWFALMASLLNLALTAGTLQTKYLNEIFRIDRGKYEELGALLITVIVLNFLVPIPEIAVFGKKIEGEKPRRGAREKFLLPTKNEHRVSLRPARHVVFFGNTPSQTAPMTPPYPRPEMARIWEPANRFRIWFEIELYAT